MYYGKKNEFCAFRNSHEITKLQEYCNFLKVIRNSLQKLSENKKLILPPDITKSSKLLITVNTFHCMIQVMTFIQKLPFLYTCITTFLALISSYFIFLLLQYRARSSRFSNMIPVLV